MFPIARKEGLHTEQLANELMVYDVARHKAHYLSPAAASVWRNCDGQKAVHELSVELRKQLTNADEEIVWMILDRLSKLNLLEDKLMVPQGAIFSTRRELMKKVAAAGGMLLLLTATIGAPTPAQASSGHQNDPHPHPHHPVDPPPHHHHHRRGH